MDWLRRLFQRPQQNNRAQDIINRSRNWGSAAQDLRNAGFNPTQYDAQLKSKFQPRPQPQQQPQQQQPQRPHLNIQAFAKGLQDFIQHDIKPIEQKVAPIAKFVVPGAALGQKLSEGAKPTNQPIQKAIVPALGNALMGASLPGINLVKTPQARQDTVKSVTSVGKAADSFLGSPSQIAHQANYAITEAQARDLLNKRQINYDTYKRVTDEALGKTTINPSDSGGTLFRKVAAPVASTAFSLISAGELPGAVKAVAPLTLGQKVIKGAKAGAGLGATYGALGTLGQKEAITPANAAQNVASGAAFGGVLGAATPLAAAGASKLLNHELTPKSPLVMTPQKSKPVAYDLNPVRDNVGKYSKKPNTIPLQLDNMKAYQQDMLNTMTRPGISATEKAGAMKNYNATQKVIDQLESGQPLKNHSINDNFNGNLNPIKSSLDVVKYPNAEAFAKAHPEVTAGLSKAQINELYQTAQKAPASVVAGLDSRPAHQVAIENALNKGDIKTAKQLVAKIPKNDPYRASMESFVNDAGVQTAKYNQATKGKPIYDNYMGPLKPEKGKKVDKIAEGLGMTEQQVNEAAGKSAPGLSIKDTNTLKKLGYTVDDFANLKPGELKLALQKGLPRDQVYKGLSAVPDLTTPKGPGEKPRGFVSSLNKDILFPSEVSGALPQGYKPITNKQTVEQARRLVDADPSASLSRFLTKPKNEVTAVDQAVGQIHLRRAIDTENTALATRLIGKIDPNAREAGRTVQILAAWKKTTPEGALSTAHKIVDEANAKLGKNKQLTLSADAQKRIVEIAKNIQKFEVGTRERQVQEALLQKELAGIVPAGKLRKISTLQTLGQLLNPKTAIRNIGGNSFLAGTENVSQSIATPLDAILGKFTKQRSVVLPKLGQELKGAKIGAQYGAEDVKLGIKSQGSEGQYSLHPDIFKKGGLLNKAEKLMGYELSVPDKAFYTAAYNESLANQVAAANKSGANLLKPTAQMKLQAESEGLYRTFQNDSKLAGWLSSAKRVLNANKDFGLGDLILKYPRTPGNIVSVGIDYAGGGAVKGVNKLVRNWGNLSAETQRQAVMDISRSITGLGMAGGAYALAKEGIIKGKQNKDKDIASAEKGMGQGPYTINLSALMRKLQGKPTEARPGDLTTNYDWIQPNAINAAIGANMASKTGTKQGIANIAESLNQGVSTVVDQPVMQGLARLASKMAGQQGADPVGAIADAVKGAPASFVPSLLNQIGQLTDKPSRNTYSPNPLQEASNMVKAKIPGLRTTLNPRYDTLGQAQQLYESNNPFNVFLNPAFVNHYKNNPVIDEVRRLEQTTSETSQYPRLVNTSQTINGQNRKLTSDELAKWQKGLGELTNNQLSNLIQTPAYQKLSDPDKVKAIQNALTSFNQITKNTIFGGEKLSKAEQAVAGGGNYAIKEKQPLKAKKAKKLKAPKKSTGGKRTTGRKSSGRVAITKPPALHLSKLSIGRAPSIKSVKLKSTAKLVSPKTSSKKITIKA